MLFLVGFMGTGKSCVGAAAARLLGREFIDLDARIEASLGMTIAEWFSTCGEAPFRVAETSALEEVAEQAVPAVVACGGGVVLADRNWEIMRASGLVVCLTAPVEVIMERTRHDASRPLLAGQLDRSRVEALLAERAGRYAMADATVESTGGLEATAQLVCDAYRRLQPHKGDVRADG
ncbi:MAG: shikimate kinase [Armatimonadetes bacterium]|jgi:shikimate kinase|nr:shikimate kinase [Armatimonadota bacterium]MDI9602078.1 shikimate kinase [Acidobacteriota bacterium]